ncbi:MAG: helix-hairpin-helix domain-containing protein [Thermodesulfobacteriota bacterium]
MRSPAKQGKRRGAALIVVLATLLALVPSVYSLLDDSFSHTREPALLANEYRAGILAESGLDIALNLLAQDADPLSDTPREPWCGGRPGLEGRPLPVWDLRGLTVTVIPCNAYLNLNAVLTGKEPTAEKPNPVRERLEKALGALLLTQQKSHALVLALQDWIDEDTSQRLPGAEGMAYASANRGYGPRNSQILRPEEVLLVAGWESLDPGWIRGRFTAWGDAEPRLNVNFAPVQLLEALVPELVPFRAQIVAFRDSQGFQDVSQLLTVTGMDEETYAEIAPFLTVRSDQFLVLSRAETGTWVETRRFVIDREISTGKGKALCSDVLFTGTKS